MCEIAQDYDKPAVYVEEYPVARLGHRCAECGSKIAKRDRYLRVKGLWDGSWSTWSICVPCHDDATTFAKAHGGYRLLGRLEETLEECIDYEGAEAPSVWVPMLDRLRARRTAQR